MIELILRENVPSLGKAGDMVRVKSGYARNFLLPHGLAFEATEGNKKRMAAVARVQQAKEAQERTEAQSLADRLSAVSLSFAAKAGEDGKLFGSITSGDIAEQLHANGFAIDKRKIELEHPLKQAGEHAVSVRLHHDVHAQLKVTITAES